MMRAVKTRPEMFPWVARHDQRPPRAQPPPPPQRAARGGRHKAEEDMIARERARRPQGRGNVLRARHAHNLEPNVCHACNCTQKHIRAPHCPVVCGPAHTFYGETQGFGFRRATNTL